RERSSPVSSSVSSRASPRSFSTPVSSTSSSSACCWRRWRSAQRGSLPSGARRMSESSAIAPPPARARGWMTATAAFLLVAVLPLVFQGSYARSILVVCAINVLLAIGLDVVIGYAGQLNLGQSAFFAIGAYVSTLLVTIAGADFWVAFLAGAV